jgi:YVTN family beta-propeller protein
MRTLINSVFALTLLTSAAAFAQPGTSMQPHFAVTDSIIVGGTGGWDYVAFDGADRTLYVAHNEEVVAIELATKHIIAHIPAHGSHGVAIAREFGYGFISNGKSNTVGVFSLKTHEIVEEIPVGTKPDAIIYDSSSKRILTMNGEGDNATVVDPATKKVVGTIALGGSPEFGVADGKGHVFVNLEDKNEVLMLDAATLSVVKRWKIIGGDAPTGLAMDIENNVLFIGCHNAKMIVMSAKDGKVLATLPIGQGVDATAYDAARKLAFSSNGDATLTIVREDPTKHFSLVGNATTERGARTMALDPATGTIYLATADFGATPPATKERPRPRPAIVDGSFKILIVTQTN